MESHSDVQRAVASIFHLLSRSESQALSATSPCAIMNSEQYTDFTPAECPATQDNEITATTQFDTTGPLYVLEADDFETESSV